MENTDSYPTTGLVPDPKLACEVTLQYCDRVNLAMQQNGVPLVDQITIRSRHSEPIEDLTIHLSLDNNEAEPWTARLARLDPDTLATISADSFTLSLKQLAQRTEAERCAVICEISCALGSTRSMHPIELLAFDQWPGAGYCAELTAAFVTPNHPLIADLLQGARRSLNSLSHSDAIDGYQSKSRQRAAHLGEACFTSAAAQQLGYINPPASFESTGQRVRLVDRILREKFGTCLDLSLMLMSLWEQCGLNTMLLLTHGHAMPAFWTHDTHLSHTTLDEPARIRNLIELGELVAVESTHLTHKGPGFEDAIRAAHRNLQDPGATFLAIDIRSARKRGVRPLPLRSDGETGIDLFCANAQLPPSSATMIDRIALADRVEANHEVTSVPQDTSSTDSNSRVQRWQKRLLDLSLRNRLLNFKETGRTLPLDVPSLSKLEDMLADGQSFEVLPRQDQGEAFLLQELEDRRLHSQATDSESRKRLLTLYRTARSSIEETGANILYLALGLLKWYEHDSTEHPRFAPLVLLPISLHRASAGGGYNYRVELSDEPLYPNVTLLEKLRTDFGILAPELESLPEDEAGLDLDLIFHNFRNTIRDVPRWEVIEAASFGLFSFNKFLMWKDLKEKTTTLKQNRLVQHLIDLSSDEFDARPLPESAGLDERLKPDDLLCTRDADSSQLAAVCAAAEQRSFILEGPPGTGKSQTIANIIADALSRGRRVLFVAEKMAALSVVRKRLEQDGLGAFCLELHAANASKKQVLEQIEESLHAPCSNEPTNWQALCKELGTTRSQLNDYISAIHRPQATGESLYTMIGRLSRLGEGPTIEPPTHAPEQTTHEQLAGWVDAIQDLQERAKPVDPPAEFPLHGIGSCPWSFSLPQHAQSTLNHLMSQADALRDAITRFIKDLGLTIQADELSQQTTDAMQAIAGLIQQSLYSNSELVLGPHANAKRQQIRYAIGIGRQRDALRDTLNGLYREEFLQIDHLAHLDAIRRYLKRNAVMRLLTAAAVKKPLRRYCKSTLADLKVVIGHLEQVGEYKKLNEQLLEHIELVQLLGPMLKQTQPNWQDAESVLQWCDNLAEILNEIDTGASSNAVKNRLVEVAQEPRSVKTIEACKALQSAWMAWTASWQTAAQLLATTSEHAFGEDGPGWLTRAEQTCVRWRNNLGELNTWCNYRAARDTAERLGLEHLIRIYESARTDRDQLMDVFWRSFGMAWFTAVADAIPAVRSFHADTQLATAERFRLLDRQIIELTRFCITARLDAHRPRPSSNSSSQSEMGILRREIEKKRRHLPTRRLIESIPTLLPRLKPCFLMSPLSVAQFLSAELPPFDLVIFDEASQIPVWDAIGAIARGKEVIVVGDSKQLPPTTFFSTLEDDEEQEYDDLAVDDMESILKECNAAGVAGMRLRWHYRSRHESLITFSNHHYYQNELHTFPSPVNRSESLGVTLRHVPDGVYDRGGTRTNPVEAQRVVQQVVEMLLDPDNTDSIGIVTFSQAQQSLIEDLLDQVRRENPALDSAMSSDSEEPVFVKNLENVQGDERDAIIFSVGYGPDQNGYQSMNFGPLNKEGGERRLNVAITRARRRLIVFTTMNSEAIDLRRTRATGVKDFKTFLDYAERGNGALPNHDASTDAEEFASGFEQVVCEALTQAGWAIDTRVGSAGYRIDLAVQHPDDPGRYILGIECDGKSYHNAKTARDRDRIRESVMRGLGWRLTRVWSVQWHVNPEGTLARLIAAIEEALAQERSCETLNKPLHHEDPQMTRTEHAPSVADNPTDWLFAEARDAAVSQPQPMPIYTPTYLTKRDCAVKDMYASSANDRLIKVLLKIVDQESPITESLAMYRFAEGFEVTRITPRFRERFEEVRDFAIQAGHVQQKDSVLWRSQQDPQAYTEVRLPSEDEATQRDIEDIPMIELTNGCAHVLREQFGLPREELIREAAKLFGINRATARVTQLMDQAVQTLLDYGQAQERDGRITPRQT